MDPKDLIKAAAAEKLATYADEKDLRYLIDSLLLQLLRATPPDPSRILSHRLQLPHISSAALLRRNLTHRTALAGKARPFVERGELAPDECVTGDVVEKIKEERGGVIEGFPRTREQLYALHSASIPPTLTLHLTVPPEIIVAHYTHPPPHLLKKLNLHRRFVASVVPLLPKPVITVHLENGPWGKEEMVVVELERKVKEGASGWGMRGCRVAVVAEDAVDVDVARIAAGVAAGRWGGVYVSPRTLLYEHAASSTDPAVGGYLEDPSSAPPDLLPDLLARRLARQDCREKGYVVDSMPVSKAMAERIQRSGVKIDRLLYIHPSDTSPTPILGELLAHFGSARVRYIPVPEGAGVREVVERCETAVGRVVVGGVEGKVGEKADGGSAGKKDSRVGTGK
ncbi:hypothetical protein HDU93_002201 [Gonapodya sp. JEL0774]|nr:hypothetical protein HDU93_002201 [Gonapodya sp. JEL0774]